MRSLIRNAAAAACLTGFAASAFGQAASPLPPLPAPVAPNQKLTLSQAIALGEGHSPVITAARHTALGARYNLSGQKQPLNPVFTFASLNNTLTPIDIHALDNPSNYSVVLPIEISGRERIRTHQALGQYQASEADLQTAKITVRESVASSYIALQVADASLESEQEAYNVAKRLRDLTEDQFRLGAAPETNAIRAGIAFTQEEQNLYQAVSNANLGRTNLNVSMGRPPDTPVDAADALTFTPVTASTKALQDLALAQRPEIRSAAATKRALAAAVAFQQSQYYPDLYVGTDLKADAAYFGISFPLFDFGSIRGAIRTAREAVHTQESQEQETQVSALQDVASAYYTLVAAQQTVKSFEEGILPRAVSLESRIEQGYKLGASTILDLIDAQETLRMTRLAHITALGNDRTALAQLERAVGGSIPANLEKKP